MADKPTRPPGSITAPADNKNERIAEISNVNRSISEMQQKVNQQINESQADVGQFEGIEDVQNSMLKVLSSLNSTVGTLGQGFAKIAADTGKASSDAIKQYGKAISEDIGANKRNIVATALAQSSPIFGYFAAKFVETDVFQSAKEKMKSNISDALGGVTSKFKEGFSGIIGKAKQKAEKEKPVKTIKTKAGEVPKMQKGGYVEKAGLASLHPAEVVVPIEKILTRIDESIDISKELANASRRAQLHSLAKMGTYVKSVQHLQKVGLFKGFLRAMKQVQEQYQEPSDVRQLRALLAIQDALGAQVGTWQQIWQKMLVEHPYFRQIAFAMKGLGSVFGAPFKFVYGIFKSRGGYAAHLSKARNPMVALNENIGKVYAEGMWRLDNIALFTKATAEAVRDISSVLTGKKYKPLEGVPTGVWSFANLAKRFGAIFLGGRTKSQKKALEDLYGVRSAEHIFPALRRKGKKAAEGEIGDFGAIQVSEIHIAKFAQRIEKYMIDSRKSQKKLLGYTANIDDSVEESAKDTKQMNRRQRLKSIFGFFGGALGGIKNLLGGAISMILPMLTSFVLPWLKNLGKTLYPLIFNAAKTLALSPELWAGAAAALIGSLIGKTLDKAIGISEGFQAHLDRLTALANKVGDKNLAKLQERRALSAKGGIEGFRASKEMLTISELGRSAKERRKQYGMWGRMNLNEIETAQRDFMNQHIGEYMLYGPDQITALRAQWIKEGGYPAKRFDYPALQYGAEREAAFLKYIQGKGKPMGLEQMRGYKEYNIKHWQPYMKETGMEIYGAGKEIAKAGMDIAKYKVRDIYEQIKDTKFYKDNKALVDDYIKMGLKLEEKGVNVFRNQKDLVGGFIMEEMAKAKKIENALEKHGAKLVEEGKKRGEELGGALVQASHQVSNYINNNSSVVHQAAERIRDKFSEYEKAIMRGDYMMEGF